MGMPSLPAADLQLSTGSPHDLGGHQSQRSAARRRPDRLMELGFFWGPLLWSSQRGKQQVEQQEPSLEEPGPLVERRRQRQRQHEQEDQQQDLHLGELDAHSCRPGELRSPLLAGREVATWLESQRQRPPQQPGSRHECGRPPVPSGPPGGSTGEAVPACADPGQWTEPRDGPSGGCSSGHGGQDSRLGVQLGVGLAGAAPSRLGSDLPLPSRECQQTYQWGNCCGRQRQQHQQLRRMFLLWVTLLLPGLPYPAAAAATSLSMWSRQGGGFGGPAAAASGGGAVPASAAAVGDGGVYVASGPDGSRLSVVLPYGWRHGGANDENGGASGSSGGAVDGEPGHLDGGSARMARRVAIAGGAGAGAGAGDGAGTVLFSGGRLPVDFNGAIANVSSLLSYDPRSQQQTSGSVVSASIDISFDTSTGIDPDINIGTGSKSSKSKRAQGSSSSSSGGGGTARRPPPRIKPSFELMYRARKYSGGSSWPPTDAQLALRELLLSKRLPFDPMKPYKLPAVYYNSSDFVFATGSYPKRYLLAQSTRSWRRGIRAFIAVNNTQDLSVLNEMNKVYGERYGYFPDETEEDLGPRFHGHMRGDSRAAMAPFLAHEYFGESYKWMLYGDDDTLFYMPAVKRLLAHLDPELPYVISDNLWYKSRHPNLFAPRCLPCHMAVDADPPASTHESAGAPGSGGASAGGAAGHHSGGNGGGGDGATASEPRALHIPNITEVMDGYLRFLLGIRRGAPFDLSSPDVKELLATRTFIDYNRSLARMASLPPTASIPGQRYVPRPACPFCTTEAACTPKPPDPTFDVPDTGCFPSGGHGGAGMIFSVGLLRRISVQKMRACLDRIFGAPGGDSILSTCLWEFGYAFTDPGASVLSLYDGNFVLFSSEAAKWVLHDPMALLQRGKCDGRCRWLLRHSASNHGRGRHFQSFEQSASYLYWNMASHNALAKWQAFMETRFADLDELEARMKAVAGSESESESGSESGAKANGTADGQAVRTRTQGGEGGQGAGGGSGEAVPAAGTRGGNEGGAGENWRGSFGSGGGAGKAVKKSKATAVMTQAKVVTRAKVVSSRSKAVRSRSRSGRGLMGWGTADEEREDGGDAVAEAEARPRDVGVGEQAR